ncbi:MAG: MucB/RseB C-terminal domain-containing protein [Pseudomonadota bacterium]
MKFRTWLVVVIVSGLPVTKILAEGAKSQKPSEAVSQESQNCPSENRPQDGIAWLNRIAKSTIETAFSGTYIHHYGPRMETSRITHIADEAGEQEKLETLDGPLREIIRKNDELICYFPDAKLMKLDRKRARKFFPALISDVAAIKENYTAKLDGIDRVAGFDCQVVIVDPKDNLRFAHRFCAEVNSGLLLSATVLSERGDPVEQFAFTQVVIGNSVSRDLLKSTYADNYKKNGWQTDKSALQEPRSTDSGWYVKSLPPGFKKIAEVKRNMPGRIEPVIQQVYSDGLASVSTFIETTQAGDKQHAGLLQQGSYNLYVRPLEDRSFTVKVLGEVPRASLQQIGNSLTNRPH